MTPGHDRERSECSMENLDALIATLNTIHVGDLDKICGSLSSVRAELVRRGLVELVDKIDICQESLLTGDMEGFRRSRATVVSRLGHIRVKTV